MEAEEELWNELSQNTVVLPSLEDSLDTTFWRTGQGEAKPACSCCTNLGGWTVWSLSHGHASLPLWATATGEETQESATCFNSYPTQKRGEKATRVLLLRAMIQREEERAVFILLYLLSTESKPRSSTWKTSPQLGAPFFSPMSCFSCTLHYWSIINGPEHIN